MTEKIKWQIESDTSQLVEANERAAKSEKALGAAADATGVKITRSNKEGAESTEVLTSAQKRQLRAYERLASELDDTERETQQLAKAQRILGQALNSGRIDQEKYNRLLGQAEKKYSAQEQAILEVRRAFDGLEDELDDAARETRQLADAQEKLNKAFKAGLIDQKRHQDLLGKAKKEYSSGGGLIASLAGKLGGLTKVAGIAAAGVLAVGAAFAALGAAIEPIARAGDTEEKLTAQLRVALGSQEQALDTIGRIRTLAAPTPLGVEELTTAWVKLQNFGLEPTEKRMVEIGDLASAMNKSLDDATEALLDASQGEGERLKEFGIRMKKEGDQATISFKGVSKTVKAESKDIVDAILDISRQNFAGSLAAQATTLSGKLSTLKDSWDLLMGAIFRSGVGDVLKGAVDAATSLVSKISGLFTAEEDLQSLIKKFTPEWAKNTEAIYLNAGARESLAKANKRLAAGEKLLQIIQQGSILLREKEAAEAFRDDFVKGSVRFEAAQKRVDELTIAFEENKRQAGEARKEMIAQAQAAARGGAAAGAAAGANEDLAKSIAKVTENLQEEIKKQQALNAAAAGGGDLEVLKAQFAALGKAGLELDATGEAAESIRVLVADLAQLSAELEKIVSLKAGISDLFALIAIESQPLPDIPLPGPSEIPFDDVAPTPEQLAAMTAAREKEIADVTKKIEEQQDAWLAVGQAASTAFGAFDEGLGNVLKALTSVSAGIVNLVRLYKSLPKDADGNLQLSGTDRFNSALAGAQFGASVGGYFGGADYGQFGQVTGGTYGDAGAQAGGFAGGFFGPAGAGIGAGLGGFLGTFFNRSADEARSQIFEAGERAMLAITTDEGGLGDIVKQVGEAIIGTVRDLEFELGTGLDLNGFEINIEGDLFEVVAGGVAGYFSTVEDAVAFGVLQALGTGNLDPEIEQALAGFSGTMAHLQEDLAAAIEIRDLAIGADRAEFRDVFNSIARLSSEILRLGVTSEEAYGGLNRSLDESRDSALGLQRSQEEIRAQRVAAWNAELLLLVANIEAQLAGHKMRRAEIELQAAGVDAMAAAGQSRRAELFAILQTQELTARGVQLVQQAAGATAQALAVIDQQILALQNVLANLPGEITPEELAAAPRVGGGSGRQRRETREDFAFVLDTLRLTAAGASDIAIALREQARDLREEAAEIRRAGVAEDLIQEWLDLQQTLEREDVLGDVRERLAALGTSDIAQQIRAIQEAEAARREELELLAGTEEDLALSASLARAEIEALLEAQETQRQSYADLADGITPWQRQLLDLRSQFDGWEQDTRDLIAARDGETASVADLAAALAALEAQESAAADALFGDLLQALNHAGVEIPGFAEQMIGLEFAMLRANIAAASLEEGFADFLESQGLTLDQLLANIDAAEQDALNALDDTTSRPSFDNRAESVAEAAAREMESALEAVQAALDQLRGNNASATPRQSFQLLQSRYFEALAAAQAGDAAAVREAAQLALQLNTAAAQFSGSARGFYDDLFGNLEGDLEGLQDLQAPTLEQINSDQLAALLSIDATLSTIAGGSSLVPRFSGNPFSPPPSSAALTAADFTAAVDAQAFVLPAPVPAARLRPGPVAAAGDYRELVDLEKEAARARKSAQQLEADAMRDNNQLLRELLASQAETRDRLLRLEAAQTHGGRR